MATRNSIGSSSERRLKLSYKVNANGESYPLPAITTLDFAGTRTGSCSSAAGLVTGALAAAISIWLVGNRVFEGSQLRP